MSYDDLKEHGSEAAVKAAGKLRQQGKPYESMSTAIFGFLKRVTLSQFFFSGRWRYCLLESWSVSGGAYVQYQEQSVKILYIAVHE